MTAEPTWAFNRKNRTERTFSMQLAFEEDLTLNALRAFVHATQGVDGSATVEVDTEWRTGHENVTVLRAITRSTTSIPVSGPQLPAEPGEAAL